MAGIWKAKYIHPKSPEKQYITLFAGFLKWGVPLNHSFLWDFLYKQSILGYPRFWNPPSRGCKIERHGTLLWFWVGSRVPPLWVVFSFACLTKGFKRKNKSMRSDLWEKLHPDLSRQSQETGKKKMKKLNNRKKKRLAYFVMLLLFIYLFCPAIRRTLSWSGLPIHDVYIRK